MDNASYQVRLNQWIEIIQAANNSGVNKTAWCAENGIHIRQFYYWQKKVRQYFLDTQTSDSTSLCLQTAAAPEVRPAAPAFCEIHTPGPDSAKTPSPDSTDFIPEIILRHQDYQFLIGSSVSESTLITVLSALRHV